MRLAASRGKKAARVRSEPTSKRSQSIGRETRLTDTAGPPTVLVVDDHPSGLRSLKRLISVSGFVVQAFDRPSALLSSETPRCNACMVVDIDMPEMNGIEMCEALKSSGRSLPAILITGRTDDRTRLLAEESDAVAVLFKPFDEKPLLDAIARALALP